MNLHVLTLDGRRVCMRVSEVETEIVCTVQESVAAGAVITAKMRDDQYDHLFAWFNAIIADLRDNSEKTIHLFDRQHVLTS